MLTGGPISVGTVVVVGTVISGVVVVLTVDGGTVVGAVVVVHVGCSGCLSHFQAPALPTWNVANPRTVQAARMMVRIVRFMGRSVHAAPPPGWGARGR